MNRKMKRRGADLAERFNSTFEGSKLPFPYCRGDRGYAYVINPAKPSSIWS
jgi:hypothetical protein